jgi:hypothetical protein
VSALDQILEAGAPLLGLRCQVDSDGAGVRVAGASALLLAGPLVALASHRLPSALRIHEVAHAGALAPALVRSSRAYRLQYVLATTDGEVILRAEAGSAVIAQGWEAGWTNQLDALLSVSAAQASAKVAGPSAPSSGDLIVDRERWERVAARALRYLV